MPAIDPAADRRWMDVALTLARRGLGQVWPNPAVGCVLVRDGRVVGRGWTQPGGRPHAETEALARAGAAARGATAYVTLEPCAHRGVTPPCTGALLAAGIARCVVALEDPDSRVAGRGLAGLAAAGVAVAVGVGSNEATELNAGYLSRIRNGRPLVTLKTATTLDGRIAARGGDSRWITGTAARQRGHLLRAEHDAVMIGANTALRDDPVLTCRLPGMESRSPVRVVVDSRMRLPARSMLAATADKLPTWLMTVAGSTSRRRSLPANVEVIAIGADQNGRVSLPKALAELGRRGIGRLLVEGGGRLAAALVVAGLVDRLVWFRAPMALGGDAVAAIAAFGVTDLDAAPRYRRLAVESVGEDVVETYVCAPGPD